ncbi:hypothetical protein BX661DRAFT_179417, partial [Kickxella alabastrina]|uniref:uncharacterized protein n=1 Tax=Kickxella alabastrina TaxID=61397 RepID=UPI00221FE30E
MRLTTIITIATCVLAMPGQGSLLGSLLGKVDLEIAICPQLDLSFSRKGSAGTKPASQSSNPACPKYVPPAQPLVNNPASASNPSTASISQSSIKLHLAEYKNVSPSTSIYITPTQELKPSTQPQQSISMPPPPLLVLSSTTTPPPPPPILSSTAMLPPLLSISSATATATATLPPSQTILSSTQKSSLPLLTPQMQTQSQSQSKFPISLLPTPLPISPPRFLTLEFKSLPTTGEKPASQQFSSAPNLKALEVTKYLATQIAIISFSTSNPHAPAPINSVNLPTTQCTEFSQTLETPVNSSDWPLAKSIPITMAQFTFSADVNDPVPEIVVTPGNSTPVGHYFAQQFSAVAPVNIL